ncbi:MAG: hypothetical protein DRJ96_00700 [Thermoprotei archaeon]|nr:MAG: hypothetical protein DRJ96_00700 [Thermoprotei archaeon]
MRLSIMAIIVLWVAATASALPLTLSAYGGVSLEGAVVEVEKLDGTVIRTRVGRDGILIVKEVPLGILRVRVVSWKGVPVGYECVVTPDNSSITVPNIYPLRVSVVGSRGQGLAGAYVKILYGDLLVETGSTDESGVYSTLLPSGTYTIEVEYGGRTARTMLELDETRELRIQLDIFAIIGGYPLSTSELIGILVVAALIPLILYIIAYEYSIWRKKRIIRATVKER